MLKVIYCDRSTVGVWCPYVRTSERPNVSPSIIFFDDISSETYYWSLTKLRRNNAWVVPDQSCSNSSGRIRPRGHDFSLCVYSKIFLSETQKARASRPLPNYGPLVKSAPAPGVIGFPFMYIVTNLKDPLL